MADAQPLSGTDESIAGLTLTVRGQFDPHRLADALALHAVRMEIASTNSIFIPSTRRKPVAYPVPRQITRDSLKVSVRTENLKSIRGLFEQLFSALESLPAELRETWSQLDERTADLGLYWMNDSNCGTEFDVPSDVVTRLSQFKISLRLSVYGHATAIDRAVAERDT